MCKECRKLAEIDTLKSEKENLMRTLEESAERIREQDNKWQKLKEWLSFTQPKNINDEFLNGACCAYSYIKDEMQELEGEDE